MGPYRSRWVSNIHTNYMERKYGAYWDESNTKFELFLEKTGDTIQWIYNNTINLYLDSREPQKKTIRIDNYDVWGMDQTLAEIIHPMLVKLQGQKHGSPWVDDADVPEKLKSTSAPKPKSVNDVDDNHHKRWEWVINEMIFAFDLSRRDWTMDYYDFEKLDKDHPEYDDHLFGMKMDFVKVDDRREVQARIVNGRRLFAKYYENLWD